MILEARPLEPLHGVGLSVARCFDLRLGERLAEQRQAFGLALAAPAIELQSMRAPVAQERPAQAVAGRLEKHAAKLSLALREGEPVAAVLLEDRIAQPTEQNVVGRLVLGVQ